MVVTLELGWFGELPGYYNQGDYQQQQQQYGYAPQMQGGHPGQSIIIQPHLNGPPTVQTVPHNQQV